MAKNVVYYQISSHVAYCVTGENKQALTAYKQEIEKLLTDAYDSPHNITYGSSQVSEYDCGDKLMHVLQNANSLSIGLIDKKSVREDERRYNYLIPEVS